MAANISNDEERERRILLIGKYFIENNDTSIRKTAQHFSEKFFPISVATVHDYLQKYKKMVSGDAEEVEKIIKTNVPETVDDPKVRKRVLNNARIFLSENKSINQIAEECGETFWTIYRDLTSRLKKIDLQLSMEVQEKLTNHSEQNISHKK